MALLAASASSSDPLVARVDAASLAFNSFRRGAFGVKNDADVSRLHWKRSDFLNRL